jgi:hypothetical protein
MKNKITVDYFGWFLFCPVYFEKNSDFTTPIPLWKMWWLFDLAMMIQQGMNWVISIYNPDACGFIYHHVKPIKEKEVGF